MVTMSPSSAAPSLSERVAKRWRMPSMRSSTSASDVAIAGTSADSSAKSGTSKSGRTSSSAVNSTSSLSSSLVTSTSGWPRGTSSFSATAAA